MKGSCLPAKAKNQQTIDSHLASQTQHMLNVAVPRRANISRQTRTVLFTLLERSQDWHHGYRLMEQTGIASGTMYPMLIRLCEQGYLEAQWIRSVQDDRPPRHAYRLTPTGLALARMVQTNDLPPGDLGTGLVV
jgi:DNA-binding HxlR family transcriptional regulator